MQPEANNNSVDASDPRLWGDLDMSASTELKLGRDVRFVLVAVGGGALHVASTVAKRKVRYLETVAINCDERVQEAAEFDRRICLGTLDDGPFDTGGRPAAGNALAHAAEPALDAVFEGATFVTIVASLGGGSGTGVLPVLLDAAARHSAVLSVFLIKPFSAEGGRRQLAERAMAGLHFLGSLTEKLDQGNARLIVLDNDVAAKSLGRLAFRRLADEYANVVLKHIEENYIHPTEGALRVRTLSQQAEAPLNLAPLLMVPHAPSAGSSRMPEAILPGLATAGVPSPAARPEVELTFEVVGDLPPVH